MKYTENGELMTQAKRVDAKLDEICIIVTTPEQYHEAKYQLLQDISNFRKKVLYVALGQPKKSIEMMLEKRTLMTRNIQVIGGRKEDLKYVSLTGLSIDICANMNTGTEYVVFDSVNALLPSTDIKTAERFFQYILNRLRLINLGGTIFMIKSEETLRLLPILTQFSDRVINIS